MRARAVHVVSVATLLTVAAVLPAAADVIEGTDGPDRLSGTAQRDTIRGYDGRDLRHGRAGDDILRSGRGHDVLYGGPGTDLLFPGKDGWTDDRVYGGSGEDTVIWLEGEAFESKGCERVLTP